MPSMVLNVEDTGVNQTDPLSKKYPHRFYIIVGREKAEKHIKPVRHMFKKLSMC